MKRRIFFLTVAVSLTAILTSLNRVGVLQDHGSVPQVPSEAAEVVPTIVNATVAEHAVAVPATHELVLVPPTAAEPALAEALTDVHLPLMLRRYSWRHVGAFVPMVDASQWNGSVASFETLADKQHGVHLVSSGFGCSWADEVVDFRPFLDYVHSLEATALITWMPMDCTNGGTGNVNTIGLPDILNGTWDAYIQQWATDIGTLGYPVLVRWGHEMNIPSYAWAGQHAFGSNGRTHYAAVTEDCGLTACYGDPTVYDGPERYVDTYRHVYHLADPLAANIVWLWNPNARNWPLPAVTPWNQYNNYYPGDAYVDWVGLDGYNWGDRSGNGYGSWVSFDEMFGAELNDLGQRYPDKVQIIAEFAAVEDEVNPSRKAAFIRDAYAAAQRYPRLKVLVWVHDNNFVDTMHEDGSVTADFRVNSSSASLQAYQEAVADWNAYAPLP